MKIKISLEKTGEWSDCWLLTRYVGSEDMTFETWIYPTSWLDEYKTNGFYQSMWICKRTEVLINLHKYVDECKEHLKPKDERITTSLQETRSIFDRIFSWKY